MQNVITWLADESRRGAVLAADMWGMLHGMGVVFSPHAPAEKLVVGKRV